MGNVTSIDSRSHRGHLTRRLRVGGNSVYGRRAGLPDSPPVTTVVPVVSIGNKTVSRREGPSRPLPTVD